MPECAAGRFRILLTRPDVVVGERPAIRRERELRPSGSGSTTYGVTMTISSITSSLYCVSLKT
jgi:hypothetical protein